MGEWSKEIGEQGENIVEYFFKNIIGYNNNYRTNISIKCSFSEEHKKDNAKKRLTHGIDGLVAYNCPLVDELLEIGLISSKYTFDNYPNNPKTFFKDYFVELAYTIKCFTYSPEYQDINSAAEDVTDTTITGLLFWLSNSEEHKGFDLIPEISNSIFQGLELVYDKIIIVDNARMEFLFNLIQPIKKVFGEENFDFIYHKTGINKSITHNASFGKKLPLQLIASNVIPIRASKGDDVYLIIGSREKFNEEDLIKYIALSKQFNHLEATTKTIISFPDYIKLNHQGRVEKVVANIKGLSHKDQIEVVKHDFDFRNI